MDRVGLGHRPRIRRGRRSADRPGPRAQTPGAGAAPKGALGRTAGFGVVAALVGYVLLKYVRRQLFLRRLRIARISLYELKRKLDAGEEVAILDLRTALDVAATPYAIPGSRWITAEALDEHVADVPRDRELVLYCS